MENTRKILSKKKDLTTLKNKFENGLISSVWSEKGELMFIKYDLDLNEYAWMAGDIL